MGWGWRNRTRGDVGSDAVVKKLRAAGCSVFVVGRPLDLLVGIDGVTLLVECKPTLAAAAKDKRRTELRPSQQKFVDEWKGGKPLIVDEDDCVPRVLRAAGRRIAV